MQILSKFQGFYHIESYPNVNNSYSIHPFKTALNWIPLRSFKNMTFDQ